DCLEQLHAVLDSSDDSRVDAAEPHRVSRLLRGSAQMARESRVQAVARALELAGRALVQGARAWGEDLRSVLERTLEDLASLVEGDGPDAQLDERAAAALERWERQGLDLAVFPGATASSWPAPQVAEPPDPAPAPASGEAAVLEGAPMQEELPIEVVNFFRSEAGSLLDRIERMVGERPPGAGSGGDPIWRCSRGPRHRPGPPHRSPGRPTPRRHPRPVRRPCWKERRCRRNSRSRS